MIGIVQTSMVLVDFYWNRDDYTQKYCTALDQGITQCKASCYLYEMLEDSQDEASIAQISHVEKINLAQLTFDESISLSLNEMLEQTIEEYKSDNYYYDFHRFVFHPPKV